MAAPFAKHCVHRLVHLNDLYWWPLGSRYYPTRLSNPVKVCVLLIVCMLKNMCVMVYIGQVDRMSNRWWMGSSNVIGKTHIKLHFDYSLIVNNKFKHAYHFYIVVLQGWNPAITIQEQFCFQIHIMSTCLTHSAWEKRFLYVSLVVWTTCQRLPGRRFCIFHRGALLWMMPAALGKLCKAWPHTHCQLLEWTFPLTHLHMCFVYFNYSRINPIYMLLLADLQPCAFTWLCHLHPFSNKHFVHLLKFTINNGQRKYDDCKVH